jgi:BirA family transcriptional regulator, biotin operon repressor / biotin---[acetyl-CoA-carboxylase] ligase
VNRGLELIRLLADGAYHSGEDLARSLGVSRTAIWKAVRKTAEQFDLVLERAPGRGYRLAAPLELLDPALIRGALSPAGRTRLVRLDVHPRIDSTNARLLADAAVGAPAGSICLAEAQSAGRGRRGRTWVSPFGANLYLSILWRYPLGPAALGGLSLAAGATVAAVLERCALADLGLKWPNDLLWRGRKLGGLLLEVTGEAQGPSAVVVGLGLNLRMPPRFADGIDQPWVDLHEALDGREPERNHLAAALIEALLAMLEAYGEHGLAAFLATWERYDLLRGRRVVVQFGDRVLEGGYAGVDAGGALRLATPEGELRLYSGEVSVRRGLSE